MSRRLVLLSNDDGYRAEGLLAMRRALSAVADVVVCAPDSEQSAASHALTLHRPLRLVEREPGLFSVDGTPADCVYVALHSEGRVLPRRPDVVVSGLNHGVNLGDDIFYSGTVAAAREGALKGVPSLAASADARADRESAAALSARLALAIAALTLDRPVLLNINFPPGDRWGLRATRIGTRLYTDAVEFRPRPARPGVRVARGALRRAPADCGLGYRSVRRGGGRHVAADPRPLGARRAGAEARRWWRGCWERMRPIAEAVATPW